MPSLPLVFCCLIPNTLAFGGAGLAVFLQTLRSGQCDDLTVLPSASCTIERILYDNDYALEGGRLAPQALNPPTTLPRHGR